MRQATIVLFGILLVLGAVVSAQNQNVSMPDYSAWEKTADHTEPYTYKGARVELRDEHYEHVNPDGTEAYMAVVFYNPDTGKPWFAAYYISSSQGAYGHLFEADQEGNWVFIQDITGFTEEQSDELFRSRYGLVFAG